MIPDLERWIRHGQLKQCLILEMGLPYINFKTIGDYIILVCYCLKLLKVTKTEIKLFVREFRKNNKRI